MVKKPSIEINLKAAYRGEVFLPGCRHFIVGGTNLVMVNTLSKLLSRY